MDFRHKTGVEFQRDQASFVETMKCRLAELYHEMKELRLAREQSSEGLRNDAELAVAIAVNYEMTLALETLVSIKQ